MSVASRSCFSPGMEKIIYPFSTANLMDVTGTEEDLLLPRPEWGLSPLPREAFTSAAITASSSRSLLRRSVNRL